MFYHIVVIVLILPSVLNLPVPDTILMDGTWYTLGYDIRRPSSETVKAWKPWTDPIYDTDPIIKALQVLEIKDKAEENVDNIKDKVKDVADKIPGIG